MRNIDKTIALIVLGLSVGTASRARQSSDTRSAAPAPPILNINDADGANAPDGAAGEALPAGRNTCWKQAGLSKTTMEQRKSIVSSAKIKIQNLQGDSALTAAQQKQQIRQIRADARQQVARLLTPEQQQALRQCREDRAAALPSGAGQSDAAGSSAAPPAPQEAPGAAQPK